MKRKTSLWPSLLMLLLAVMLSSSAVAQKTIRGKVTDAADGLPLPTASIVVKGTTVGTAAGTDGSFSLTIPAGAAELVISMIGYVPQTIIIGTQEVFDVALATETTILDEVVVIGYGEQSRSLMSTSVSKLDMKVLESAPRTNVGSALQGTVAGLRVITTSGQPGQTPNIVLRGGTDWNSSSSSAPLVIIDGVVSTLYGLNSDDIESMEVLKDAAATAIYGARAANGVILISTKKGKVGKAEINYTYKFGLNRRRQGYEYLNARDYIYYNRLGLANYRTVTTRTNFDAFAGSNGNIGWGTAGNLTNSVFTTQRVTASNRDYLENPEWQWMIDPLNPADTILFQDNGEEIQDLAFQNSFVSDHHLSFSGGNENGLYAMGLGFLNDQGIVLGSELRRFTANFNGSYNINDRLKVSSSVNFANSEPKYPYLTDNEGAYNNIFERVPGMGPTARVKNPDGSYNPWVNSSLGNPLYYEDKFWRRTVEQRLTAGASIDYDIIPDLTFTLRGSFFTVNLAQETFDKAYYSGGSMVTTRNASVSYSRTFSQQYNALLNYSKKIGEKHTLNAMAGTEYYNYYYFTLGAWAKNSPTNLIYTLNASPEASGPPSSSSTAQRLLSALGRISYDFDARYLVNINLRYDGSSKLGNDKWGFFPGVSFGWNIHNEEFFRNSQLSNYFSNVKPRISYGVNGNVDNLGNFYAFGGYALTSIYNGEKGYYNNSLPLLDLRWESSTTFDVGIDLGLLNDRITIIADFFLRDVYNKLAPYALPYETGFTSITTNNGTLRNRGLEIETRARVIDRAVQWDLGATFYTVKNFVVRLPENGIENNRQGGTRVYDPELGRIVYVAAMEEGKRVGNDEIYAHKQEYVYADPSEVAADAARFDVFLANSLVTNSEKIRFPGDVRWADLDGNDTINNLDRILVGRTIPSVTGGFTSSLSWKGVSLFVKTDYALGHIISSYIRLRGITQVQGSQNSTTEVLDSWTPDNIHTDVPRFDLTDPRTNHGALNQARQNSRYWEKGDYICLREVTLSYDFPAGIFRDYVKNLRVYFTGSNLAYLTRYTGYAPEQGGIDIGRYPVPRVYTFGLSATF